MLQRVLDQLRRLGAPILQSTPLKDDPPWYLRPIRSARELPLLEQALLPMQADSLPPFRAKFGPVTLRTGDGHFLLWLTLSDSGALPHEIIDMLAHEWKVCETRLHWPNLLPSSSVHSHGA